MYENWKVGVRKRFREREEVIIEKLEKKRILCEHLHEIFIVGF